MAHEITRRDALKAALKNGAYVAPAIAAVAVPGAASAQVSPPLLRADLAVTISATGGSVTSGGLAIVTAGMNAIFTIIVTNNGPIASSSVTLTDTLPPGLTFVSASAGGALIAATSTVQWNLGTLSAGATMMLTLVGMTPTLTPGGMTQQQSNSVTVSSPTPDPNPANNTASVTFFIMPVPVVIG